MNKSGKYSFYVHDYTNRNLTVANALSSSGAVVRVYDKESTGQKDSNGNLVYQSRLIATYFVPAGKQGTLWHVFDYNALTKDIIAKDTMTFLASPVGVGAARITDSSIDEEDFNNMLIDMIDKD